MGFLGFLAVLAAVCEQWAWAALFAFFMVMFAKR